MIPAAGFPKSPHRYRAITQHKHKHKRLRWGSPLSAVLAGVVLVLSVSSAHAARPWSVQFGGCVFSGDYDGAPLVRSGSCATKGHSLNLYDRGITSVKSDSFADMGACQ